MATSPNYPLIPVTITCWVNNPGSAYYNYTCQGTGYLTNEYSATGTILVTCNKPPNPVALSGNASANPNVTILSTYTATNENGDTIGYYADFQAPSNQTTGGDGKGWSCGLSVLCGPAGSADPKTEPK